MNLKLKESIDRIADGARGRYRKMLADARAVTKDAAGTVKKTKAPVQIASKFGLKISALSHKTADRVVKQQTKLVENQIDAFAGRLTAAAGASGIRELVDTQLRMIPENVSRFATDTRDTLRIFGEAGQEVGSIVAGTISEFRAKPAKARKAAPKAAPKAAKKAGKKTAKKAVTKKVAKKTAKKTSKKAASKKTSAKAAARPIVEAAPVAEGSAPQAA